MRTYHIHIEGQVQGVGFRPFVYRLAKSKGLNGSVSNGLDGVHIYFNSDGNSARIFLKEILSNPPERAKVLRYSLENGRYEHFDDFRIVESSSKGRANLLITPDLGLCEDCRRELHDPANHRYHYPFITCINCGPRYSIMAALPYDRENTTMDPFQMCVPCREEYNSPVTRRHYSQTNSCPDCSVQLSWYEKRGTVFQKEEGLSADEYIARVIDKLAAGKIIGIKGIGGYLLICDAASRAAINELRLRKSRPSKPFALMYPDIESLRNDAILSDEAAAAFQSIESPIVLCSLRSSPASGIVTDAIAPHLNRIGAMQPYAPLFDLLLHEWKKPIVATSGNLSGSPVFFDDEKALDNLGCIADAFLVNNRRILVPQDDSVVQYTPGFRKKVVLRRSRAFAPTYIHQNFHSWRGSALAMGADMKSTFSVQHAGNTYVSQYLGDLESFETQQNYQLTLNHFLQLFASKPDRVIIDKHPAYFSSAEGLQIAGEWGLSLMRVQHHEAHFAAVMAENDLLECDQPVLGIIWDGTGWGNDGNIWGGEFFLYKNCEILRIDHLARFPHLLGDKMSKEPRLSALSICRGISEAVPLIKAMFTQQEWAYYSRVVQHNDGLMSSSMGRLFDGVAALLGLVTKTSFEGEAAMRLEALATSYSPHKQPIPYSLDTGVMLREIIAELKNDTAKNKIAFRFHFTLVKWIEAVARRQQANLLAFSGGVFQNALLVDLAIQNLKTDFQLYFHQELSPNDECISFGQLAHAYLKHRQDQKI